MCFISGLSKKRFQEKHGARTIKARTISNCEASQGKEENTQKKELPH